MGRISQLSAGEAFDDFTTQPVGEGYITLRSSAGNRLVFRSPAEAWAYQSANPAAALTNEGGSYNDQLQNPTSV